MISFRKKYILVQQNESYEELGYQFIEDEDTILALAGNGVSIAGNERFFKHAKGIVYCLQARYLGYCSLDNCKFKKVVDEALLEISTLST